MANIDVDLGSFDLDSTNSINVVDITFRLSRAIRRRELVKADGAAVSIARRRDYRAQVVLQLKGSDYTTLRGNVDSFIDAIDNNALQKLTLDDERYLNVVLGNYGLKWRNFRTLAEVRFDLTAPYPFWLAETADTDSRSPASGSGYTLTQSGNAKARTKITLTNNTGGDITDDIQLENQTLTELFRFRGTLADTKALVIDNFYSADEWTVLNDGVDARADYSGDLLHLASGANTIELTSAGGGSITVLFDWRKTWK